MTLMSLTPLLASCKLGMGLNDVFYVAEQNEKIYWAFVNHSPNFRHL